MGKKICSKCNNEKEATKEYFYSRKDTKDGLRSDCKECTNKRVKTYVIDNKERISGNVRKSKNKYRKNNKEKISKQSKEYNLKNIDKKKQYIKENKEQIAQKVKEYKGNNKEEILKWLKQYRKNNKRKLNQAHKQYYKENKDKIYEYQKQYREENKYKIQMQVKQYYNKNKYKYVIYSEMRRTKKLSLPSTLTMHQWKNIKISFNNTCAYCNRELPLAQEHFLALSRSGEYTNDNIIPSCKYCNSSKGSKDFFEWYPRYKYYSKQREKKILKHLNYNNKIQQLSIL